MVYDYCAVVEYYDKNQALRTECLTVPAKSRKEAEKQFSVRGKVVSLRWENLPDNPRDRQMELFE